MAGSVGAGSSLHDSHFVLSKQIKFTYQPADAFCSLAVFPWTQEDLLAMANTFKLDPATYQSKCSDIFHNLRDAVAVGGFRTFTFCYLNREKRPSSVELPQPEDNQTQTVGDCIRVAWAIRQDIFFPVILFSYLRLLYIFDVQEQKIINCLRGHGGSITSIAVHPKAPFLLSTTSRDFSIRIYNLNLSPHQGNPENVHLPPAKTPCYGGPAHGLQMSEVEGKGTVGRCVYILRGGWSGGHQSDVLCAAFHPDLPLIATGGMDRAVKIWYIPPEKLTKIKPESVLSTGYNTISY